VGKRPKYYLKRRKTMRVEYSNHAKRFAEMAAIAARGVSGFSPAQVRTILAGNEERSLKPAFDLRAIGCPDHIFQRLVERRAKTLGIAKSPDFITDEERRAQAARTAALIKADNERHDGLVSLFQDAI
jgi:hypothetical protein